jgi:hypothetical protein
MQLQKVWYLISQKKLTSRDTLLLIPSFIPSSSRLTVSHLKCRDIIAHAGLRIPPEVKSELGGHLDPDFSVVDALDGFSLVLSQEGDVIHVSNNVTTFIGLSSFELLGNTFSEFVHPCDHEKLRLLHPQNAEQDAHVEVKTTFILADFLLFVVCTLCSCFLGGFSVVVCVWVFLADFLLWCVLCVPVFLADFLLWCVLCSCCLGGFSVLVCSLCSFFLGGFSVVVCSV